MAPKGAPGTLEQALTPTPLLFDRPWPRSTGLMAPLNRIKPKRVHVDPPLSRHFDAPLHRDRYIERVRAEFLFQNFA